MAYDKVVDSAALDGVFSSIADAIRTKNHTSNHIPHENMAQTILDLPTVKIWDITVAEAFGGAVGDVTELSIVTNDEFIKNHYENDNLKMLLVPKSAVGENAVGFMFGGNVPYYIRPSGTEYRTVNALNTNGSSSQIYADAARLYARTSGVGFYLLNTGEIRIRCLGARTFAAGEYIIVAMLVR